MSVWVGRLAEGLGAKVKAASSRRSPYGEGRVWRCPAGRNGNVRIFGRVRGSSLFFEAVKRSISRVAKRNCAQFDFSDSAGGRVGSKEQKRRSESCLEGMQKVSFGQF